jgi:hypothetical protein
VHPVLTTRIGGVGRAIGGVFEIAGGLATSEFGIGILPVVKGIDDLQTGLRQAWTGQDTKSLIYLLKISLVALISARSLIFTSLI